MLSSEPGERYARLTPDAVQAIRDRAREVGYPTQAALAEAGGLLPSDLSPVLRRHRPPSQRVLVGLAKALKCSEDEVRKGEFRVPAGAQVRPMDGAVAFPTRGRSHAQHDGGGFLDDAPLLALEDVGLRRPEYVEVFEVTGECMVPEVQPGARVFVDTSKTPQDGETVVFQLRETPGQEVQLKRIYDRGADVHLVSSRGEVKSYPWRQVHIIGTVFQVNNPPPPRRPYPK